MSNGEWTSDEELYEQEDFEAIPDQALQDLKQADHDSSRAEKAERELKSRHSGAPGRMLDKDQAKEAR